MEPLIISIGIFAFIIMILLPVEKIIVSRNMHKLIVFINDKNTNNNNSDVGIKEKLYIYCERIYIKLHIRKNQEKYEIYRRKLILSNLNEHITVECFIGMKILSAVAICLIFLLLSIINKGIFIYVCILFGTTLAYYYPDSIINIRIKNRQLELQRELPDILKTLAITVEAGLSFWDAVKKVCEVKEGVLIDELKKTMMEINMGVLQKDALIDLSERCKVTEITIFIFTVIQTLEKGSSGIIKALNDQANEAWEIRKNKAKEQGHKASIKLFLSMLIFVFPCLLIFLLGPAIISIIKFFGSN